MRQIGVRELRQNASRYLLEVQERGASYEVTDRGRPVALLVPVPPDHMARLIAEGRITPPREPGGLLSLEPRDFGIDASGELARMREDER